MDASALGTADWERVVPAVNQFWVFAAFLVLAALSFGLAAAIIPSLLVTRQLSGRAQPVRWVLYAVSAISFALSAVFAYRAIVMTWLTVRDIYPRWWI